MELGRYQEYYTSLFVIVFKSKKGCRQEVVSKVSYEHAETLMQKILTKGE